MRLGIFVHASAAVTYDPNNTQTFNNDFTLSGSTDTTFAGVINFDSDGDYRPNGTLSLVSTDCATLTLP